MASPQSFFKYIFQIIPSQLKWASELFHRSFFSSRIDSALPGILIGQIGVKRYELPLVASSTEAAECSICLCKIEGGDEVRELRCHHLFHRVCLDRWLGFGRMTCPLCRNHLTKLSLSAAAAESDEEVLFFTFCDIGSNERDRWWIR
ncbi:hypothetical protein M9H77_09690 [Catharanthus roseus]|uniref:Uncharacterized protein n=1 Tax=Catharanthus roseus TaxID=4058 RepID=A0ACC0C1C9_CATRO|nr:hypothetical protein M9H77_09690 [Catharanthus roseus]